MIWNLSELLVVGIIAILTEVDNNNKSPSDISTSWGTRNRWLHIMYWITITLPQKFLLLEEQETDDSALCIENGSAGLKDISVVVNGHGGNGHVTNDKTPQKEDPEGKSKESRWL